MSKYRITLEGKVYEMEIEEIVEEANQVQSPQTTVRKAWKAGKSVSNNPVIQIIDPAAQRQTVNNTGAVTAPMPGTVIRIEKKTGNAVKAGELVLILEAMKMENEILAPTDGTITVMNCKEGGTVAGGDVLFEVK